VLRSKVRITDESDTWAQYGVWDAAARVEGVAWDGGTVTVKVGHGRFLRLGKGLSLDAKREEDAWTLEEIRAGRPLVSAATQDQFVPQMLNLEKIGGVDFQKGCYPGQEIVARAQYRGEVKRRLKHLQAPAGTELKPGQEFGGGVVVDAAAGEVLAVVPV
jgi:folate-binding protein YgfZ